MLRYNFNMMSQKYQTEQQELTEKIERLSTELESEKQTTVDAETWISLIKQYANPTELTAGLLNTLIEKMPMANSPIPPKLPCWIIWWHICPTRITPPPPFAAPSLILTFPS